MSRLPTLRAGATPYHCLPHALGERPAGRPAFPLKCQRFVVLLQTDETRRGVAKVCLKVSLQVTDSSRFAFAVWCVAFVITFETCQELYFQPFVSLANRSADLLKNTC